MFFDSNNNLEGTNEMNETMIEMDQISGVKPESEDITGNVFSYLSTVNANIGDNFSGRWYNVTFTYFGSSVQHVRRILARNGNEAKQMLTNELRACFPINPGKVVGPARCGVTNRFAA